MTSPHGVIAPRDIIDLGDGEVRMLDQTRLPAERVIVRLTGWRAVEDAIRTMIIRGAPAIGIAGAMGVALAAQTGPSGTDALLTELGAACDALAAARPTAVNLAWAVDIQRKVIAENRHDRAVLVRALTDTARTIHDDEVERCVRIGEHGRRLIGRGARILTHCNAGALATGGYGTALGVVRAAHAVDPTLRVYVDETRPLLQGARLTAWELGEDGIDHTLITDSMAAAMMAAGRVTHVVVGADRIAANGDVVNKIGTYGVALLARAHGIPMIVAAPTSTLDLTLPSGAEIPIEERASLEVTGLALDGRSVAPDGVAVANPAFDRTPHHLVSAIVTEMGVHRPPYDRVLAEALSAAVTSPGA